MSNLPLSADCIAINSWTDEQAKYVPPNCTYCYTDLQWSYCEVCSATRVRCGCQFAWTGTTCDVSFTHGHLVTNADGQRVFEEPSVEVVGFQAGRWLSFALWVVVGVISAIQFIRIYKAEKRMNLQLWAHIVIFLLAISRIIAWALNPFFQNPFQTGPVAPYIFSGFMFPLILLLCTLILYNWAFIYGNLIQKAVLFNALLKVLVVATILFVAWSIIADIVLACNTNYKIAYVANVMAIISFVYYGLVILLVAIVGILVFYKMYKIVRRSPQGRLNLAKMAILMAGLVICGLGFFAVILVQTFAMGGIINQINAGGPDSLYYDLAYLFIGMTFLIEALALIFVSVVMFILKDSPKKQAQSMSSHSSADSTASNSSSRSSRGSGTMSRRGSRASRQHRASQSASAESQSTELDVSPA